jgi:hypothetical protein
MEVEMKDEMDSGFRTEADRDSTISLNWGDDEIQGWVAYLVALGKPNIPPEIMSEAGGVAAAAISGHCPLGDEGGCPVRVNLQRARDSGPPSGLGASQSMTSSGLPAV